MRALLTLKIPIIGRIVLLSIDIFKYSMSPIEGNIFDLHTKDPDPSPPQIKEFATPVVSISVLLSQVLWGKLA